MVKILTYILTALVSTLVAAVPVLAANSADISTSATVSSYLSVTFNYASAGWSTIDISGGAVTDQAADNNNVFPYYNVSVSTNDNYKLEANGTDMTLAGYPSLLVGNISVDSDTAPGSLAAGNSVSLTASPQVIDTGILYNVSTHYNGFYIDVPAGFKAGTYTGTITMIYSSV